MRYPEPKRFRSLTVSLFLIVLGQFVGPGVALAEWISLGGPEGSAPVVTVLESSSGRIVLDYSLPGFEANPITIEGRTYYTITLAGESNLFEKGLPELPQISRSVIIPDDRKMSARILDSDITTLTGYAAAPSKGTLLRTIDPVAVPYTFDPAYQTEQVWPEDNLRTGTPYILRDYRGMVVEIVPFQTHFADGSLSVARHLTVELTADGSDGINIISRFGPPETVVTEFDDIYRRHFMNYGMDRYTPLAERGKMLIITYDAFHSGMDPFVEWKNQKGTATTLVDVSTIGNNATAIKNYIQNQYNAGGLAFVLLVGDGAQIATPQAAGGSSDPTYSLLLGTDNYPEIFVGRFSAETLAQVQTQVQRSIAYEKTPQAGATWYPKGTGIGSDQGPGDDGEYDYQHIENIRTKLLNYGYTTVDQIYDPSATAAMVSNALNAGRSIVNYCGHGSQTSWGTTGFSNTNVNALVNDNMLPFIFSVACVNGQFEGATCFAEAWLRATHNGNPTGAIGAYMSSINQSWNPPMAAEDECDQLLISDQMRTFGGLCYNGSCRMMDEYGADGANMFLTWHIFGDPSLLVRTKTPQEMTVQTGGALFPGQSDFQVTVAGVSGALAALYAGGVLYGAAYTDLSGNAVIHMDNPPMQPMTLTLTITSYNKIPAILPIEVLPPNGPYLVFDSATVLDAAPAGDGDGGLDASEAVGLRTGLKNIGVDAATNVTATLGTLDPNVEVTGPQASFGTVPAGQIGYGSQPFAVAVSPNAPDQHVVPFGVVAQGDQGSWNCNFSLTLMAPVLTAADILVDDSAPGGNANGTADPGETFIIYFRVNNTGHASIGDLTGTLTCSDPNAQILDNLGECLLIPMNGNGLVGAFEVQLTPQCPSPSTVALHLALSRPDGFFSSLDFPLTVGPWFDDVETDRGWTCGWAGDTAATGLWTRVDPNGTTYNGQQCQPEDDHTADPGVICFVTGNGTVGGAAGEQDVDGGKTTLMSPVFPLGGATSATLSYWRWYTNNLGNNPNQDYWDVDVTSDGTNWVHLEHTTASANSWNQYTFVLENFVTLTDQVRIRFVADDVAPNSLIEAAVDDIMLTTVKPPAAGLSPSPARPLDSMLLCRPNPFGSEGRITYRVEQPTHARISLYDVSGRMVRSLVDGRVEAGEHAVVMNGPRLASGIYFLRMETDRVTQVRQVTVVR